MLARILAPVRVHRVVGVLPGAAKDADDAPTSTSAASASASVDAAGGAAITVPKMAARRRPSTRPERRRFLGYEHRRATASTRKGARIEFLARFPTPEAVLQVARERVREITARRPVEPVEQTVLNLFLRGWSREHRMPGSMRRREESGANAFAADRSWHRRLGLSPRLSLERRADLPVKAEHPQAALGLVLR